MLEFNLTLPVMMVLFLVFAWLMNVVFFKPVSEILEKRREYVQEQKDRAAAASKQFQDMQADYEARLKAAHGQAQEALQSAIKDAEAKRQALIDQVRAEVAREVADARKSIQSERTAAIASLQSEVGSFADQIKRKVLGGSPAYSSAGGSDA